MHFVLTACSLILIDLLLAGDNALVIAMAVRSLPSRQRRMATAAGAGAAVLLRVALTAVASHLLRLRYLQLAGGALILWIALKVMVDAADPPDAAPAPARLLQAVWYIVLADLTMSTDNILAIAGAAKGHLGLIVFGLCVSIPFVVLSSNLLAALMDRFPALIYLGAGILGKVGGEMILTDPVLMGALHPDNTLRYAAEAALIVVLLVAGRWITVSRLRHSRADL